MLIDKRNAKKWSRSMWEVLLFCSILTLLMALSCTLLWSFASCLSLRCIFIIQQECKKGQISQTSSKIQACTCTYVTYKVHVATASVLMMVQWCPLLRFLKIRLFDCYIVRPHRNNIEKCSPLTTTFTFWIWKIMMSWGQRWIISWEFCHSPSRQSIQQLYICLQETLRPHLVRGTWT